jgi:hypothetical protein
MLWRRQDFTLLRVDDVVETQRCAMKLSVALERVDVRPVGIKNGQNVRNAACALRR